MCKDKIYIYGGSGHGLVVADIARACGYKEIVFIDDGDNPYPSFDKIKNDNQVPIALGVGDNKTRATLFKKVINYNFQLITLIHPSAIVSSSVTIGIGSVIMPNVVVNSHSILGKCVILNSSSIIEHENSIRDFTHISPAVALSGNVTIDNFTHIGIGTSIRQGINIGKNCIIGAGSVVVKNIKDNQICFGNPCKIVRNNI
jgi:UDP-N-acetylbacillosamine N-acetyltransferase